MTNPVSLLLLLALLAPPAEPFTSPGDPAPEYGLGLSADDARAGWISLFDGQTSFGWEEATAEDGTLRGGSTTAAWSTCTVRGMAVSAGTLRLGEKSIPVAAGDFEIHSIDAGGKPIQLAGGLRVRQLQLRPLELRALFDGKSLDGWKIIPHPRLPAEKQAKWSVENEAIRGVGGPGALEFPERWADLVLQLEVRARATLANGGVFIRSQPGQFMNGYEAQVFNACYGEDPARPARYSTGAIDDRQLARRLVSRDGEWFTITVVARGRHLATWVNGYQMTDWTDDRPEHDNPREGYRPEPGTLQLQAHDPATDVEFRHVRIGTIK